MKSRTYKQGRTSYRLYLKKAGNGYETGFTSGKKVLFRGNFINSKEANLWYSTLNKEIATFSKKYWATEDTSKRFYQNFISNFLYKKYYEFVNKCLTKNNRQFTSKLNKDLRSYKKLKKDWSAKEKLVLKRSA